MKVHGAEAQSAVQNTKASYKLSRKHTPAIHNPLSPIAESTNTHNTARVVSFGHYQRQYDWWDLCIASWASKGIRRVHKEREVSPRLMKNVLSTSDMHTIPTKPLLCAFDRERRWPYKDQPDHTRIVTQPLSSCLVELTTG